MSQVLKNYDANNWSSKINKTREFGSPLDIKSENFDSIVSQTDGKTFGEFLTDSISKVNSLQNEANVAMEKLATGKTQNIHETLLAVEKADIAFKTMNQVRQKVIEAYREIMRMQV
ncbi:MAG: flagellar hook-basal body complex protein FliE [Halobacteriovoraceae bacterium]|nr:flagellar hook-basal body complex protein FliE [Halobacteriovoraceae bacterium]MCB9095928.1 flagellar hook-basal body complex protein FliE [Halobacteriovoraceae bacterium]